MVRIPPSIPHGTQALLPSKFCLLAPPKRARIVSRSGERCVRIHMDAHHRPDFSFQFFVRFLGLSLQNRISQKSIFRNFFD